MARLIVRCQHTGHYVLAQTGNSDTRANEPQAASRDRMIFCPYCQAGHVVGHTPLRGDETERRRGPAILLAS